LRKRPPHLLPIHSGLGEGAFHLEGVATAIGLDVDPCDQVSLVEERQHVVAIDPLRFRNVDLDAVVEVPEPLHPGPIPDQAVER
jgi:hypothetical protein